MDEPLVINIEVHVGSDLATTVRTFTAWTEAKGFFNVQHDVEFADVEAAFIGCKMMTNQAVEDAGK